MIYTIENEFLQIRVSTLGATLVSFIEKKTGTDIVLGYDDEKNYLLYSDAHLGATVGRNANRIGKGRFSINGEEYQLTINNGPNDLHSGAGDFSFRSFDVRNVEKDQITFSIKDNDMSGGFPGDLYLEVSYTLRENELIYSYRGLCNKDSILNVTNHSYFNLDGGKNSICDHELKMFTNRMSLNDEDGMATDEVIITDGTSFDFNEFRRIGDNLDLGHENLSNGGIDHNYVYENMEDKRTAVLRNGKLELEVSSDLPCVHVYTANYVDGFKGKGGQIYDRYWGICLECDYYPNGINYDGFIKPLIRADEEVEHYIRYTVRTV